MPGYPNKITRNALGPTYQNATKIGNPKEEIDASIFNLMCWQVAGMNAVSYRGVIIGRVDNATIELLSQSFAWDPNGILGPTVLNRSGAGIYSWTLPSAGIYSDMNGNAVPANVTAAIAHPNGTSDRTMIAEVDSDGNSGSMRCFLSGAATDVGGAGVFKTFVLLLF